MPYSSRGLTSINDTEVFIGNDGDALVVNIGAYLGPNAMGTISLGEGNYVDGSYAISLGYNVTTEGSYSVSIGAVSSATKDHSTALGGDAYAEGVGSTAIGYYSRIEGENSTALGANSTVAAEHTNSVAIGSESATSAADQVSFGHKAGDKQSTSGSATYDTDLFRSLTNISDIEMHGALTGVTSINGNVIVPMNEDVTNKSLAIGTGAAFTSRYSSETICKNAIVIGNGTSVAGDGALAIGYRASSDSNNGVAIGSNAYASYDGTALGYAAQGNDNNAVAIGAYSGTTEENQVSFGHKAGDTNYADHSKFTDDLFRSLVNVADIDMHGNISLGGEWKENTTSPTAPASTGSLCWNACTRPD